MTTETKSDLIEEVEALLASWRPREIVKRPEQVRELLRRLVDENKALRAHVADLNHDMEASNQHCEEYHEVRTGH